MLAILYDPDSLLHRTVELLSSKLVPAFESPERLDAILKALHLSEYHLRSIQFSATADAPRKARLLEVASTNHNEGYIQHLQTVHNDWVKAGLIEREGHVLAECFTYPASTGKPLRPPKDLYARAGYYSFDLSSGVMSETYQAVVASANLAFEGADMLLGVSETNPSQLDTIFALCRPPGHHCDGQRIGGYCYINNAAVAVATWRSKFPDARIGILDIDFHHGNGTQEIFYSDPKVMYVSIHGQDEYPYYTGAEDETGIGEGQGFNINYPLKVGSSLDEYLEKLRSGLKHLSQHQPEFLIVSLGFDTFHGDPLGFFQIHTEDYGPIGRITRQTLLGIPALILLEGGYVIESLGDNVLSFLKGWNHTTP